MTKRLVQKWRKLKKLVAAVGGLMILIGVVLLGVAILASLGFANVGLMLERKYVPAFVVLMVLAGLFDTFAAALLARW